MFFLNIVNVKVHFLQRMVIIGQLMTTLTKIEQNLAQKSKFFLFLHLAISATKWFVGTNVLFYNGTKELFKNFSSEKIIAMSILLQL